MPMGYGRLDSIVDSGGEAAFAVTGTDDQPGPPVHIERSTMTGAVRTREVALARESICIGGLFAERRQEGCVRFSFVPADSVRPQRYRCQPDLAEVSAIETGELAGGGPLTLPQKDAIRAIVRGWLVPVFTSDATASELTASFIRTGRARSRPVPRMDRRWAPYAT